jgi:hypothetical protein
MTYIILISTIAFTLAFVLYSKYQFADDRGESIGKWHIYGFLMRAVQYISLVAVVWDLTSWQDKLLIPAIAELVWEIGINRIALRKKWNYIGMTATFDKKLGKSKFYILIGIVVVLIVLKIFL